MKLASCFNKISFSLEDRAEINALVRENGGDESAGVQAYIDGLIADIEDARSQIAEQGFDVALPAEAKQVEEPKVATRNETTAKPEETAKPTPKKAEPKPKPTGEKIEDFGEKIGGAQKDKVKGWLNRVGEVTDAEIDAVPLSKSWPEPDYAALIEGGSDPAAVAFIHAARDEIPNKPRQSWKLKRWAEQVRALREFSTQLIDGTTTMAKVRETAKGGGLGGFMGRVSLYEAYGHEKSLKGVTLKEGSYSVFGGERFDKPQNIWVVRVGRRDVANGRTEADAITNFVEAYDKMGGVRERAKGIKFEIRKWRSGKTFIGRKIGSDWIEVEARDNWDWKEAREYLAENQEALEAKFERMKQLPPERGKDNSPRVGEDHRNGQDVTPEMFSETFGFRGVQFGNYVEGPRRQQDLNEAYDGLMDLAAVINIPTKAISLNGSLGLAFGARGSGRKASAHYEPGEVVINLTKGSGAGSLAHEWWHGLDHYFAIQGGKKSVLLTEVNARGMENVRPEVLAEFENLMKLVRLGELKARSMVADKRKSKPYFGKMEEMTARSFESYVIGKLQDQSQSNDYLANILSEEAWNALEELAGQTASSWPYVRASEMPEFREAFDNLFDTIQTKETPEGTVIMYQRAMDMFYSPLLRALNSAKQKQAPAKDWKAILSKLPGVKKAEMEWLGVDEWLDAQEQLGSGPIVEGRLFNAEGERVSLTPGARAEIAKEKLRSKPVQITRDALIEFVRDSQIEIVEVVGVDNPPVDIRFDDTYGVNEAGEQEFTVYDNSLPPNRGRWEAEGSISNDGEYLIELERTYVFDSREQVLDWAESKVSENLPSGSDFEAGFEEYTESGGDNYREVLLVFRNLHRTGKNARARSREAVEADQERLLNGRMAADLSASERAELDALIEENTQARSPKQPFVQSGHFEQENIVVHARIKDRIGPNGEKILFVEEIQSDLASKWREANEAPEVTARRRELAQETQYLRTVEISARQEFYRMFEAASDSGSINNGLGMDGLIQEIMDAPPPKTDRVGGISFTFSDPEGIHQAAVAWRDAKEAVRDNRAELLDLGTEKTVDPSLPDTPFQQSASYSLMVKRLLRMAAEGGYDRLSWTPGYMQAERWNNAAQSVVEGVRWGDATSDTATRENAVREVTVTMTGGEDVVSAVSNAGIISASARSELEGKPLSQLVGPGLAKRIMSEPSGSVTGQKITFPSSGYAIAYDQQTRKAVNTLAKKDGTQVYEDKTLPDMDGNPVWSIDINDSLRASALEPMAILRKGDQPNVDTAKIEALMPALRKRLDDLHLRNVNLEIKPEMREQGAAEFGRDESITVLIGNTLDGVATVNHETIHILKAMGLFTKKEWATLEAEAKRVWMAKYDIANRYGDLDEAGQIEEAIAEAFADYAGRAPNNLVQSAMAKIKRFFRALKETLLSNKITDVSDIFSGVDSGRVSRRRMEAAMEGRRADQRTADITKTDAFKKWFGDSKVVDENGMPMVVYHGTGARFEAFDPNSEPQNYEEDRGVFHFTSHQGTAQAYSEFSGAFGEVANETPTVISAYLSFQNPLEHWATSGRSAIEEWDSETGFRQTAERQGRDGIIIRADDGESLFVAFRPEQIKSVFNRGTFDTKNPNILFQRQLDERASEAVGEPVTHGVIADTPISVRKESMLRAFASQPIDQVIRIPWQLVGGLDSQGAWKPGNKLDDLRQRVSTESRFSENGPFRFMNPLMTRVRAGVVDRFGQSPEYIETDRRRGVYQNMIASQGQEHLQAILNSGASPEEAKVLGAMLAGEPIVDADMLKLAQPIRRAVDDFGSEAVELGMISRESYERNRGSYMHRVYEKHEFDDGAVGRWATGLGRKRRKQVIGSQLKGRGLFEEVTPQEMLHSNKAYLSGLRGKVQKGEKYIILDRRVHEGQASMEGLEREAGPVVRRVYWPAQEPIPDALADYDNRGTFEVRSESKNKVVLWRDYTKEERLRMGEILDARYTVAKTFSLMAHDLATGRFFKDIAENEEWTRSTPPAGAKVDEEARNSTLKRLWIDPEMEWVKVPDAKIPKSDAFRYGALAGKYVRAEIWRDMEELRILQTPSWLNKLNTQWKLNKTARSPVTHMNNVMSNFMLMDMADIRMPDLTKGISEMAKGGPLYQEAKANGAFGADFVTQEIQKNVLEPLLKEIRDKERGGKGGFQAQIGHLGWVMDRLYRGLKAVDKKMIDAYQAEDQVFRMATYIRRRQQGASVEEAAVEARDQFINYDIRAPWINALRRTGLPFLAYTYRAIPKVAQTALKRPWKLAKYLAIYQALNMLAYTIAPGEDDEETERGAMGDYQAGKTWFGMPHMVRMPWLSEGNPVFLDVKRWIPAGDVFDTNGTDLPAWMHIGGPVVMGLEVYFNKSLFTDDEIVNTTTDTFGERTSKRAAYTYKAWMPSHPFIPGSWYNERVFRAARGDARKWGSNQPYSLREELASAIGLKLKPIDVDVGYKSWDIKYDRISRELGYQKSGLKRELERKLIDKDEYNRQLDRIKIKEERVKKERKARKALSR